MIYECGSCGSLGRIMQRNKAGYFSTLGGKVGGAINFIDVTEARVLSCLAENFEFTR